jgi:ubiquinone biosynthesis protein
MFVLPGGRIAVVDFGIMGRIDRRSRVYLAQILHGFLTENYYNLAKVHFDAGFVPAHKSVDSFALALMAITKPIIGLKLNDISVARLLGQLFTTAETFEMEAQPHLLLLQKNMMLTEGVGRMLNPEVNMWQVVQPLIGEWARKNLGVKAQVKEHAQDTLQLLRTLPTVVRQAEQVLARVAEGGLRDHLAGQRRKCHNDWLRFAWGALLVFAAAYLFKH